MQIHQTNDSDIENLKPIALTTDKIVCNRQRTIWNFFNELIPHQKNKFDALLLLQRLVQTTVFFLSGFKKASHKKIRTSPPSKNQLTNLFQTKHFAHTQQNKSGEEKNNCPVNDTLVA